MDAPKLRSRQRKSLVAGCSSPRSARAMSFAMVSSLYSDAPGLATLEESVMTAAYRRHA
jgi:hypothetical protein